MDFSSASFIMALGVVLPGWAYFAIGIPVLAGTVLAFIKTAKDNKKKKAKSSKRS